MSNWWNELKGAASNWFGGLPAKTGPIETRVNRGKPCDPQRSTIAGMMAVVVFVALDAASRLRTPEFYIGVWLIGVVMQVGFFAVLRSRGRSRRFWIGFEITGLGSLLAYAAWCRADYRAFNLWPYAILERIYAAFQHLPARCPSMVFRAWFSHSSAESIESL